MSSRRLPVPPEHREFEILIDGEALPRSHAVMAVLTSSRVNKIATAELWFADGDASSSEFTLSSSEYFLPGKTIQIRAGTANEQHDIFHGIVVSQALKIREQAPPQLHVVCKHDAVRMSLQEHDAAYFDQTDSDIMATLAQTHQVQADVASTEVTHEQMAQWRSCDWDFLMHRALANGLLVFTKGAQLQVQKPEASDSVMTLQFGATVLAFDAEIDARDALNASQTLAWDAAQQQTQQRDGADTGLSEAGNLSISDLAEALAREPLQLSHTRLSETEAQQWADAARKFSHLDKIQGRLKCHGVATVHAGDWITLSGFGERFSGEVLVTGVNQEYDATNGWRTQLQFGGVLASVQQTWLQHRQSPSSLPLVPNTLGLQIGVVTDNEDPSGEHRVRVHLPLMVQDGDGLWARVATLDAGDDRGFFFRPEIGDEVVVGFFEQDARYPVLLGMLHSSAKAAPLSATNDNHEKQYKSRSGMTWTVNDEKKSMHLATPAGQEVLLSDDEKGITLKDQHGNRIVLNQDGIVIESATALQLKTGTTLAVDAGSSLGLKAAADLKLEGTAGAELSSTAITTVKGSMLQLN